RQNMAGAGIGLANGAGGGEKLGRGDHATNQGCGDARVYRDNQDAMSASIRMRLRGWILG
ncbi:MAG: hypothetical protein ACK55J_03130, partial [Alphaproteobacteria bacterium]